MKSEKIVDEIVSGMERLPEIPSVALKINALLDNPDTDAYHLAEVIMLDPSLTAQVLKICNSAEYGFSRKIATIREAVSILGYKVLKTVIYTIITHGFMNRPINGYALEKGALWENAITCGAYARFLAESAKVKFKDPELPFVAGLLRDIGKIALESYIDGSAAKLEAIAVNNRCSFNEAEEYLIGASHTVVGSKLATRWNLPESLTNVIVYHHCPSSLPSETTLEDKHLVSIIHLADSFTMMSGTGVGVDGLMYPLDPAIYEVLKIDKDSPILESWYSQLLDLREEIVTMSSALVTT